jgi:hypothetical protein
MQYIDMAKLATEKIMSQYTNWPNWTKLMQSIGKANQPIEDTIFQMLLRLDINPRYNKGLGLDLIGELLDLERTVASDAEYAMLLRGKVAQLASHGTREDIIDTYKAMSGAGRVIVIEYYPAAIQLEVDTAPIGDSAHTASDIIRGATGLGVGFLGAILAQDDGIFFGFSDAEGGPDAINSGTFGDLNDETVGSPFATLILS